MYNLFQPISIIYNKYCNIPLKTRIVHFWMHGDFYDVLVFVNVLNAYFHRVEHKLQSILLLKMPGAVMKADWARKPATCFFIIQINHYVHSIHQRSYCALNCALNQRSLSALIVYNCILRSIGAYKVTVHKKSLMGVKCFHWLSPADSPLNLTWTTCSHIIRTNGKKSMFCD